MRSAYLIDTENRIYSYDVDDKISAKTTAVQSQYPAGGLAAVSSNGTLFFYVLSNTTDGMANLSICNSSGTTLETYDFSCGDHVMSGLAVWPNNGRIVVAHSDSSLFLLDFSGSGFFATEITTGETLTGGMATVGHYGGEGSNSATFYIPLGEAYPRRIRRAVLDKKEKTVVFYTSEISDSVTNIPQGMKGIASFAALEGDASNESSSSQSSASSSSSSSQSSEVPTDIYSFHVDVGNTVVFSYTATSASEYDVLPFACVAGASSVELSPSFEGSFKKTVTTRQFNPFTGEPIGDIGELWGGEVRPGDNTPVVAIDMKARWTQRIFNVKLGVTAVSPSAYDPADLIHVDTATYLPYTSGNDVELYPPTTFEGLSDGTFEHSSNIAVGSKSDNNKQNESNYVLLSFSVPSTFLGRLSAQMKWFFDYE